MNREYPVDHSLKAVMQYEEITKAVIGCAYCVYNTMGFR